MRKLSYISIVIFTIILFVRTAPILAKSEETPEYNALSIRLEQPKTPTNLSSQGIVFVALDLKRRPVHVICEKWGLTDGGYIQFGLSQTLSNGGNTGTCFIDSSILANTGTYKFRARATTDTDTAFSNEVTLSYVTEGPGDPRDYGKSKPSACEYIIHFKTADDAGKTVKVEIYRSENTSFTADSGTRVSTLMLGSNQEHDETITGTCDKTYYFAVRAFDLAGNGSNVVGDSETNVTITLGSTTQTTTVAPPVIVLTNETPLEEAEVLGEQEGETNGTILGEATPSGETHGVVSFQSLWQKIIRSPFVIAGAILLVIGLILLYVGKKQNQKI